MTAVTGRFTRILSRDAQQLSRWPQQLTFARATFFGHILPLFPLVKKDIISTKLRQAVSS